MSGLNGIMVRTRMPKLARILCCHSTTRHLRHVYSWLGHYSIRLECRDIYSLIPWCRSRNSDNNKMDSSFILYLQNFRLQATWNPWIIFLVNAFLSTCCIIPIYWWLPETSWVALKNVRVPNLYVLILPPFLLAWLGGRE
jgi:hypothetical protein